MQAASGVKVTIHTSHFGAASRASRSILDALLVAISFKGDVKRSHADAVCVNKLLGRWTYQNRGQMLEVTNHTRGLLVCIACKSAACTSAACTVMLS